MEGAPLFEVGLSSPSLRFLANFTPLWMALPQSGDIAKRRRTKEAVILAAEL